MSDYDFHASSAAVIYIAADDLAPCVVRASDMILYRLYRYILFIHVFW